jgi:hypothetical protein
MLTQEFCDFLEYYLSETLSKSTDIDRRRCWCDGVIMPKETIGSSVEEVTRSKRILTQAWIDEGRLKGSERGQFIYTLTIKFGSKSLEYYKNEFDLSECLNSQDHDEWVLFDREKKEIELQLL